MQARGMPLAAELDLLCRAKLPPARAPQFPARGVTTLTKADFPVPLTAPILLPFGSEASFSRHRCFACP
jgi:hypothetical protein